MTTQVSFTTDSELKKLAIEKAKAKGLTLKSILVHSMKAFVEEKLEFGIIGKNKEEKKYHDFQEIHFDSQSINKNAKKLAQLLQ